MIKELTPTFPKPHPSSHDYGRLDSWKEIANYFRREVRTVQLWEKREGLPVHRHFHKQLGSVFAFRSELDAWNNQVSLKGCHPAEVVKQVKPPASTPGRITIRIESLHDETAGQQT